MDIKFLLTSTMLALVVTGCSSPPPQSAIAAVVDHYNIQEIGGGWHFVKAYPSGSRVVASIKIPKKPPVFEDRGRAMAFVESSICPSQYCTKVWAAIKGYALEVEFNGVADGSYMLLPCPRPKGV